MASNVISVGALIGPSVGGSFGPSPDPSLGNVSFAIGAAAFAVLLGVLAFKARRGAAGFALLALFATTSWTAVSAAYHADLPIQPRAVAALEMLRSVTWLIFLASLLLREHTLARLSRVPPIVIALAGVVLCAPVAALPLWFGALASADGPTLNPVLGLLAAIASLFMTETLYRKTAPDQRWAIKFLCISTGMLFAYDLSLYADASLFRAVDPALQEARGAVQALSAPMVAVAAARADLWNTGLRLSRRVVTGSVTMIASGIYLSLAALAGYWLREVGGQRGEVFQIVFLVGALAVLAVTLFSGTYWAYLRTFVNRHFFRFKYDWREEWLRFMATLASVEQAPLEERCIKAIADLVESPGGTMIFMDEGFGHRVVTWNFAIPELTSERARRYGATLKDSQAVIDLEQLREGEDMPGGAEVPRELLANRRAWLVVPLWHRRLVGIVTLEQPRAPRSLDWEDYDLLGVAGRQAASYLAEQRAQDALEDAREFEIFNRRFAFVVHDVKNLLSQLSVLGSNFEKYGHRQEFRDDVVQTLKDAAEKMNRLMERINAFQTKEVPRAALALQPIVQQIVAARQDRDAGLTIECDPADLTVVGDPDRLEALISHLVENAVEAVKGRGKVQISVRNDGRYAVLDVTDDGPGMAREFVQRELFKPFQSTKMRSMGIGVYQCREYAREFGGNLEAISAPGEGTTMRVTLPVADMQQTGAD